MKPRGEFLLRRDLEVLRLARKGLRVSGKHELDTIEKRTSHTYGEIYGSLQYWSVDVRPTMRDRRVVDMAIESVEAILKQINQVDSNYSNYSNYSY